MPEEFILIVPIEPVAKARPRRWSRVTKKGVVSGAFTPDPTAHAENLIRDKAIETGIHFDRDMPLEMSVTFVMSKPKSVPKKRIYPVVRPDLDNLIKTVKDALSGIVYHDDSQIVRLTASKLYFELPGITIYISRVNESDI